jgi:hypothetical protein
MGFIDGLAFWFGKLVAELLWAGFWLFGFLAIFAIVVWRQDVAARKRRDMNK